MTNHTIDPNLITKLQQQATILKQVPERSKVGFSQVADQMGRFSVSFAAGVTQAYAVRERLAIDKSDLGIKPLREDFRQINQEINAVFQDVAQLIKEESTIKEQLQQITTWALDLEQDAFLPAIADQIKGQGSHDVERQTLGSIVDSLVRQLSTMIHDLILSTQESTNVLNNLSRRLSTDLEASKHNFNTLKNHVNTLLEEMTEQVKTMDLCCANMESHSNQVNSIVFSMVQEIQYDDISAQRWDHTLQNLQRVEQRLDTENPDETDKRWSAIATSIAVKHLEDISTDLVTAVQSLHQHVDTIETVAKDRKNSVIDTREIGIVFQQNTLDLFYHLSALLRISIFDNDFSTELLRNFSKTENAIFQSKRAFETLHLTSQRLEKLLSTLDCKNNHRMETLADAIRKLIERIQTEGSRKSRRLIEITNQLQDVSLNYSEQSTPKIMRATTLLRRVPLRAQQIESDHGDVLSIVNETVGETQSVIVQTKLLSADMDFHKRIQKGTEHITEHLRELLPDLVGEELVNSMNGGSLAHLADEFEDLSNLYTMASERVTHGEALGDDESASQEEIFGDDDGCELF